MGSKGDNVDFELVVKKRMEHPLASQEYDACYDDDQKFVLNVKDEVVSGIRHYGRTDPKKEVGGILLGRHIVPDGQRHLVLIEEFLPLPSGDSSWIHFSFDDRALLALHKQAEKRTEGVVVVGWFHTHVGLGNPFMSLADCTLHAEHFRESWHVSLVVDIGEWSFPFGCWRMDGERLLKIPEFYVKMSAAASPSAQSQRFLQACLPEHGPMFELIQRMGTIIPELGLEGGELETVLRLENGHGTRFDANAGPLSLLTRLSVAVGSNPQAMKEAEALGVRLERIHFLEDCSRTVLISGQLNQRIVVCRNKCYSFDLGSEEISCGDLIANRIWPMATKPPISAIDVDFSPAGNLWLLGSGGEIYIIEDGQLTREKRRLVKFELDSFGLTGALEIAFLDGQLYIRTETSVIGLQAELKGEHIELTGEALFPIERSVRSLLLKGAGMPSLLQVEAGRICIRGISGKTLSEASLPAFCRAWVPRQACRCSIGIYVLFEARGKGILVLLDDESLEMLEQYSTASNEDDESIGVVSICTDIIGRLFVHVGNRLLLLGATGSMNQDWYHALPPILAVR